MGFNFFKALYRNLTNIGINIGLNIIVLILHVSRKTRGYISYVKYRIRVFNKTEKISFVDKRFYEKKECSNEQVVFPFYKCCQIKCSSRVDNEIKLTDIEFDIIKHIGMILETGSEKSKITLKDVISFCNLPKSIENIVINSYPWENVKSITLNLEVSHIIE